MREAPSIPLIVGLLDMGAKVRAHDPAGMEQARKDLPEIEYCDDPYLCARGADAVVLVTEWVQYRAMDLERLRREMAQPVVVDLRNVYRPEDMAAHGFVYESLGRGKVQLGRDRPEKQLSPASPRRRHGTMLTDIVRVRPAS
jgi:UDPglucose 6-dehydrogenase